MRRLLLPAVIVTVALMAALGSAAAMGAHATGGKLIAFVRGTATQTPSVWVASVSGASATKIGDGDSPLVSPNGQFVAASRFASSGRALTIFSTSSKVTHRFVNLKTATATPVAWSPDSRYVAVQVLGDGRNPVKGSGLKVIDTTTMRIVEGTTGLIYGASFEPSTSPGSFHLLFGVAQSYALKAKTNIEVMKYLTSAHTAAIGVRPLTTDGRSLNPLWTLKGIVYDRETPRHLGYSAYQLWLRTGPNHKRQLTHMKIGPLVSGLVPIQASSNGNRLIAHYVGEDTDYAWRVQMSPFRVSPITIDKKQFVQAGGITSNGRRLLLDNGAFMDPASKGRVETIPFFGGAAHILTRGASPSWNS